MDSTNKSINSSYRLIPLTNTEPSAPPFYQMDTRMVQYKCIPLDEPHKPRFSLLERFSARVQEKSLKKIIPLSNYQDTPDACQGSKIKICYILNQIDFIL